MAQLIAKLTLTSTNASTDALDATVTDTLTIGPPTVGLSTITETTATNQELVDKTVSNK